MHHTNSSNNILFNPRDFVMQTLILEICFKLIQKIKEMPTYQRSRRLLQVRSRGCRGQRNVPLWDNSDPDRTHHWG